ncbi:MAG: hypothetical protein QM626_02675 [Microbacterium sp.]|uniref:hypothetical protein n=1 Tax=Microbacterium sp. TaxID=51671 RepID=UPI0039E47C02
MSTIVAPSVTAGKEALERWELTGRRASIVAWSSIVGSLGRDELMGAGVDEAVLIPDSDIVELVVTPSCDWAGVADSVAALQSAGWMVTVLTQLASLGEAHNVLAGTAVSLQGCWRNEAGWRFSPAEIA